jgi:hypothetical protein
MSGKLDCPEGFGSCAAGLACRHSSTLTHPLFNISGGRLIRSDSSTQNHQEILRGHTGCGKSEAPNLPTWELLEAFTVSRELRLHRFCGSSPLSKLGFDLNFLNWAACAIRAEARETVQSGWATITAGQCESGCCCRLSRTLCAGSPRTRARVGGPSCGLEPAAK